jgi:hypothetical protein
MNTVLRKTGLGIACALAAWLVVGHDAALAQTTANGSIRGTITDEQSAGCPVSP